jgi:hypothetical protein
MDRWLFPEELQKASILSWTCLNNGMMRCLSSTSAEDAAGEEMDSFANLGK